MRETIGDAARPAAQTAPPGEREDLTLLHGE
jgi:hypothetical protein